MYRFTCCTFLSWNVVAKFCEGLWWLILNVFWRVCALFFCLNILRRVVNVFECWITFVMKHFECLECFECFECFFLMNVLNVFLTILGILYVRVSVGKVSSQIELINIPVNVGFGKWILKSFLGEVGANYGSYGIGKNPLSNWHIIRNKHTSPRGECSKWIW